jgi:hypothetical protein
MDIPVTNHFAETAVPGQAEITVRAARGQLEIGQEYDGEWHGIYVNPEHVLTLIHAMLRMIGMDDVYLYRQKPGSGLCQDVAWPEGLIGLETETDQPRAKPQPLSNAERQRRYRQRRNEKHKEAEQFWLRGVTRDADPLQAAE